MKPFKSSGQSFNEIPLSEPKKSSFDLTHANKGTGKIGRLIPLDAHFCLPGDRISCDVESLLRFEPLAVPLLSNMYVRHHEYFVPWRQLWTNFEKWITGGKDGYSDSHVLPRVSFGFVAEAYFRRFVLWLENCSEMFAEVNDTSAPLSFLHYTTVSSGSSLSRPERYRWTAPATVYNARIVVEYKKNLNPNKSGVWLDAKLLRDMILLAFGELDDNYVMFTPYPSALVKSMSDIGLSVFDSLYGVSGQSACLYDVWKYNIQGVLDKWKSWYDIYPRLTDESDDVVCLGFIEDFLHDLYDICLTPFIGPSSLCDYFGIGVDFWNRNGYGGILDKNRKNKNVTGFDDANWFYNDGSPTLSLSLPCGIYYNSKKSDGVTSTFSLEPTWSALDYDTPHHVMDVRAFYRIWYYNYRDQNLESSVLDPDDVAFKVDEGWHNIEVLLFPRVCAWSKDLFTTATLQAYTSNLVVPIRDSSESKLEEDTLTIPVVDLESGTSTNAVVKLPTHFIGSDNSPLASISGLTLSNLRKVEALARWLDKNLFIGFQYADQLFSHYNVKYSDARLQIPEYLGGDVKSVNFEVITNNTQTLEQDAGSQVSRAYGGTVSSVNGYFCEEHGSFISLMSILPEQTYPFGLKRSALIKDKFDVAFPEFAQLGSDIINSCEVYNDVYYKSGRARNDSAVYEGMKAFGYQGRYYDYKSRFSEQHGELNSTRREYTFARFFEDRPKLDYTFIHCTPLLDMFVSKYTDQFVYDVNVRLRSQRSLPIYDQVL